MQKNPLLRLHRWKWRTGSIGVAEKMEVTDRRAMIVTGHLAATELTQPSSIGICVGDFIIRPPVVVAGADK